MLFWHVFGVGRDGGEIFGGGFRLYVALKGEQVISFHMC